MSMSVVKSERTDSAVQYFTDAKKLYVDITKFLISDFGVPEVNTRFRVFAEKANMEFDDMIEFAGLVDKYHLNVECSYQYWVICHYRDKILDILDDLLRDITDAYTIYPTTVYEFNVKRNHQTDAISDCEELKHQLSIVIELLPVNMERYVPFVRKIDSEIGLLKQWRKDSNKLKKTCYKNDEEAKLSASKKVVIDSEKSDKNRQKKKEEQHVKVTLVAVEVQELTYNINSNYCWCPEVQMVTFSNGMRGYKYPTQALKFYDENGNEIPEPMFNN